MGHARRRHTPEQIIRKLREADRLLGGMSGERKMGSWHLVTPDGRIHSAGAAVAPLARLLPGGGRNSHEWTADKAALLPHFDESGITAAFLDPEQGGFIAGPKNLALALVVGRGLRYSIEGFLAMRYGEQATRYFVENKLEFTVIVILTIGISYGAWWWLFGRKADQS